MLHRIIHSLLGKQKSASYVRYQDLESRQMLFDFLAEPNRFLGHDRRYATSLTSSMTFGFRIVTREDPRLRKLFQVTDHLVEITQSASGQLLEVFPGLRNLPDIFFPERRFAKACHFKE